MTVSVGSQSLLASPVAGLCTRTKFAAKLIPARYGVGLRRTATVRVRSMSDDDKKTPTRGRVSTNFGDLFAFSGPAPERINGRLAMIGFVAAIAVELSNGQDVFSQISNGGVPWFLGTSAVLTVASLIPLFKGVPAEAKTDGVMTSDAEIWNGRLAMLGLVALAFTEFVKGGALV